MTMVFLKIISCCGERFRSYDGFKFYQFFLESIKKNKNTRILRILKISEKSNARIVLKWLKFVRSHSPQRN